jgi:hypothetical protein
MTARTRAPVFCRSLFMVTIFPLNILPLFRNFLFHPPPQSESPKPTPVLVLAPLPQTPVPDCLIAHLLSPVKRCLSPIALCSDRSLRHDLSPNFTDFISVATPVLRIPNNLPQNESALKRGESRTSASREDDKSV